MAGAKSWAPSSAVAVVTLLVAVAAGKSDFSVLTMNLACRDTANFVGCDNCQHRFQLMAAALRGDSGFSGVPNLNDVDLVVAQEVGTDNPDLYKALTDVMTDRGFTRSLGGSNLPHPDGDSPQCRRRWPPKSALDDATEFFYPNGGLLFWSKYPILAYQDRDWCSHGFPTVAGFVSILLNVEHTPVSVTNLHMFPQSSTLYYEAKDIRNYQFGELQNYLKSMSAAMDAVGSNYLTIVGGDFNEDLYQLKSESDEVNCALMTDSEMITKYKSINFDVAAACTAGAIPKPTWSPSQNDLTARFTSNPKKHESIDFLLLQDSKPATSVIANNTRHLFKKDVAWTGTFCVSSTLGTLGATEEAEVHSLTDHLPVTAKFALPPGDAAKISAATTAWTDFQTEWSKTDMQKSSCGSLEGTRCLKDSNCCGSPYSLDGINYVCDETAETLARRCTASSALSNQVVRFSGAGQLGAVVLLIAGLWAMYG